MSIQIPIPLAASNYSEDKVTYPCYIQPKLDGLRCLYHDGKMYSRDHKVWNDNVVRHIVDELKKCIPSDMWLDGELYKHGWPLNRINSAVGVVKDYPSEDTKEIQYYVYDIIDSVSMQARLCALHAYIRDKINTKVVNVGHAHFKEQCDDFYNKKLSEGYEGIIYRIGDCPYFGSNNNEDNRSPFLLKRKKVCDDMFTVLDVIEAKWAITKRGKNTCGSLLCLTADGKTFTVGSGLDDRQRYMLWKQPTLIIGKKIRVVYERLSPYGKPLKPRTCIEWL